MEQILVWTANKLLQKTSITPSKHLLEEPPNKAWGVGYDEHEPRKHPKLNDVTPVRLKSQPTESNNMTDPPLECRQKPFKSPPLFCELDVHEISGIVHLRTKTCEPFKLMELPPEVRNIIFYYAILAPMAIRISSACRKSDPKKPKANQTHRNFESDRILSMYTTPPNRLRWTALGLLRSNRQIRNETKTMFYENNTFYADGNAAWLSLYLFLDEIKENISSLRHVMVDMGESQYIKEHHRPRHGPSNLERETFECKPSNHKREACKSTYLNSAIEGCFHLFERKKCAFLLKMILLPFLLPGVEVEYKYIYIPENSIRYNTELPQHIESLRRGFCAGKVDVIWEGRGVTELFVKNEEKIAEEGWDIVETKNHVDEYRIKKNIPPEKLCPTVRFLLRRNQLWKKSLSRIRGLTQISCSTHLDLEEAQEWDLVKSLELSMLEKEIVV